ncbi:MAG: preprotein translocase subunit SecF [Patescibacteria group bacterium]|nr:preprotein translocase subunit SecF [Patescibacteria group bacterium]
MAYVAYQFKDKKYGIAAILAVVHDTIILLGSFAIFGKFLGVEVDTLFVTAVLTTLSFSVHDTIVVFDRIRENLRKNTGHSLESIIDTSILTTLPRSLNNSLTIIFMLTCLFLFGGITIKWFVVALLIGTILGTYSSPFVASPLLYLLSIYKRKTKS